MAEIIEKTGKSYNIFDKVNKVWNKISFWHKASDCEFNDGKNAQTKVGAIDGITSDLSGESKTVAASIKCVNQLNNRLTNENSETFNFGVLNGVRGFFTNPSRADDSFIPFISKLSSFETIHAQSITATNDYKCIIVASYQPFETDIQINGISKWGDVLQKGRIYCLFVDGKAGDVITIIKSSYYDWDIITLIG